MADDALSRWELEDTPPSLGALPHRLADSSEELTDLAAAHPDHDIWAERLPGVTQLKYVAQRRQGSTPIPISL
jgi:hypothetical protein